MHSARRVMTSYGQELRASSSCHGEESCKTTWPSVSKLSSRVDCFTRSEFAMTRSARQVFSQRQVTGLSSRTQCGDLLANRLLATGKQIASTTPPLEQVWLVAGSHLGFSMERLFKVKTKKRLSREPFFRKITFTFSGFDAYQRHLSGLVLHLFSYRPLRQKSS